MTWKPAAGDGPATPRQSVQSVIKVPEKLAPVEAATCAKVKPWITLAPAKLASCGKGRGRVITGSGGCLMLYWPGEVSRKETAG